MKSLRMAIIRRNGNIYAVAREGKNIKNMEFNVDEKPIFSVPLNIKITDESVKIRSWLGKIRRTADANNINFRDITGLEKFINLAEKNGMEFTI